MTTVNPITFGAKGDGIADDRPAIAAAIASLPVSGGMVEMSAGIFRCVMTADQLCLGVPSGVTIQGAGADLTSLVLAPDDPASYRELIRVEGSGIVLEDLTLTRTGKATAVLLKVYPVHAFLLNRVMIDGATTANGGPEVDGIEIASVAGGASDQIWLKGCAIRECNYGFFQASPSTASLQGLRADTCLFDRNYSDDLGFNAPNGVMTDILVSGSWFTDNQSPGSQAGGGFAVSLANVQRFRMIDCHVRNHQAEAVHVEDRSSLGWIERCSFAGCSANGYAVIQMISGASRFVIRECDFDGTCLAPTTPILGVTWGGASFPCANNVHEVCNTYRLTPGGIYLKDDSQGIVFPPRAKGKT